MPTERHTMIEFLSRLFVRDYRNTASPAVRARYGTMVSVICILLNLLLTAGKLAVGTLLGSIAITADAVNNLSDAGSSLVSLVSFRMAAKPADREHPFGHARIEYVASMIVSFLILVVGFELLTTSIGKISAPAQPDDRYLLPSILVLCASIVVKLAMAGLNRGVGRRIDSSVMRATAVDSLSDCLSTFAVLLSTVLYALFGWVFLDAIFGVLVSLFILFAGCRLLNETKNTILGERPVEKTVADIRRIVSEYPEALGIHDLMVHDYGPGHVIASLHVEVDGSRDFFEIHDVIDTIERRLSEELSIQCTIHADPLVIGDPETDRLHERMAAFAATLYPGVQVHDFRLVRGRTHSNLIFDVAVPYECPLDVQTLRTRFAEEGARIDPHYCTVITIDRV